MQGKETAVSERIDKIKSMLDAAPGDVFLHYTLAMEYAALGHFDDAIEEFKKCIELDSDYLPAYVEAGKVLRTTGRLDEARETFATGLKLATAQGEHHTCDYINQQLDALPKPQNDKPTGS